MSSVPSSFSRAETCLLIAGWPMPHSLATAEKLPLSTTLTKACIALTVYVPAYSSPVYSSMEWILFAGTGFTRVF